MPAKQRNNKQHANAQYSRIKSNIEFLAETLSPDFARLLHKHYAGIELRVPHKVKAYHHLTKKLGLKNAQTLCAYGAGSIFYIPCNLPPSLQVHHAQTKSDEIRKLVLEGVSRCDIAMHLGISDRHVRRLISKMGLSYETGKRASNSKPTPLSSNSNGGLTHHANNSDSQISKTTPSASSGKYGYSSIK